ncbi:hypothetical protein AAGV28_03500 [Flavobacterium sp. FZUC8N2.13]|uniref:Phage abortive infection protein n=1 Tax=Flavobacterium zubiriense TaxID=3138075 RepID=A0ABV4T8T4_9FLAO
MKIELSKNEWFLIVFFGVLILFTPYLITRNLGLVSFVGTGEIGDTIGGITAPFLGFFGSVLVYLALKAQIDANEQVRKQFEKQEEEGLINNRIEFLKTKVSILREEINSFYFSYMDDTQKGNVQKFNYQGSQAIHKLLVNSKNSFYGNKIRTPYELEPKLLELKSLLIYFKQTVSEVLNDTVINQNVKDEYVNILAFLFDSKLKGYFNVMEGYKSEHNEACSENCGNFHGIPSDLFEVVKDIESLLNN